MIFGMTNAGAAGGGGELKFAEGTASINQDWNYHTVATLDFTPLVVFAYPTRASDGGSYSTTKEVGVELSHRIKTTEAFSTFRHESTATPIANYDAGSNALQVAVKPVAKQGLSNYFTANVKWIALGV